LAEAQGPTVDLGGYYRTDSNKTADVMRPSQTLNRIMGWKTWLIVRLTTPQTA
jgi:isocitrate dehydrogenase